jgi:hypothetical protein
MKIIIILALTVYVISKIGGFFFRAGISSQQQRYSTRRPDAGPAPVSRKEKKTGNIKGGEYVDYEEIK